MATIPGIGLIAEPEVTSPLRNDINQSASAESTSPGAASLSCVNEERRSAEHKLPVVGDVFAHVDQLVDHYLEHGRLRGFCIIRHQTKLVKCGRSVTLTCHRGGKPQNVKRGSKRIGCEARITAHHALDGTMCIIKNVVEVHNHDMDPCDSKFMHGHRSISSATKRMLEVNEVCVVRPCKSAKQIEVLNGGAGNTGCTPKDCTNFVDQCRRERLGKGEAATLLSLFKNMPDKDKSFFQTIDLDDDNRIRHVFWLDPRARVAYGEFNDVITFDTTYLVNRYDMPFASFVGVNHHGQSILLGYALISSECADAFRWVFRTWLRAMGGVMPALILTDEEEAIKIAIQEVMPETRHRFCIWHILSKVPTKFASLPDAKNVGNDLKETVYDNLTIAEFEEKWGKFITKHGLENNRWLTKLYAIRESWVLVYLKHIFSAGMSSTQRSESIHSFFDGYINRKSSLTEFVQKFEMVVAEKTRKEVEADYLSRTVVPKLMWPHPFEVKFRDAFTNSIFSLVQKELARMACCYVVHEPTVDGDGPEVTIGIKKIRVAEKFIIAGFLNKRHVHTVTYKSGGNYYECTCKKFESSMLLCCHILLVSMQAEEAVLNDRYLPRRWRKDVTFRHNKIFFAGPYPTLPLYITKYQFLEKLFNEVADLAIYNQEKVELVKKTFKELKKQLMEKTDEEVVSSSQPARSRTGECSQVPTAGEPLVRDPLKRKAKKGRKKNAGNKGVKNDRVRINGAAMRPLCVVSHDFDLNDDDPLSQQTV